MLVVQELMGKGTKDVPLSISKFVQNFDMLNRSPQAKAALMSELPRGMAATLKDWHEVFRGVDRSIKSEINNGKLRTLFEGEAGPGAFWKAVHSATGLIPGFPRVARFALNAASKISPPDRKSLADGFLASDYGQQVLKKLVTAEVPPPGFLRRAADTPVYKAFAYSIGAPGRGARMQLLDQWFQGALTDARKARIVSAVSNVGAQAVDRSVGEEKR